MRLENKKKTKKNTSPGTQTFCTPRARTPEIEKKAKSCAISSIEMPERPEIKLQPVSESFQEVQNLHEDARSVLFS